MESFQLFYKDLYQSFYHGWLFFCSNLELGYIAKRLREVHSKSCIYTSQYSIVFIEIKWKTDSCICKKNSYYEALQAYQKAKSVSIKAALYDVFAYVESALHKNILSSFLDIEEAFNNVKISSIREVT